MSDVAHIRRYRPLKTAMAATAMLLLAAWLLDRWLPPPVPEDDGAAVMVLARDGTPLRAFADAEGVWRYPVNSNEVSPLYLEALVAYEDRKFLSHPGVDPLAIGRAAWQNLRAGRVVSGGSTLTMQVARLIEPRPRNLIGKAREALRALQLERRLGKGDILGLYINRAPFGGPIEGVEAASWAYLGKPSGQLSHAEAALLAVLPQAPSRLRPDRHPERARAARDKVLRRMADLGVWNEAVVADALMEPVVARRLDPPMIAPLLAERLRHGGGGRIRSTLDVHLQRMVEARVEAYLARLPERSSVAVLVVDNASMQALAYVGSARFGDSERNGHVDMVAAWRSPGSALKPLLYGLAMDQGLIHSESLLVDAPQNFRGYRPGNFDERFNGPVSAAEALRLSLNVPAVDLLDRVTPERFVARLAHGGLTLRMPRGARPNLSLILGGGSARLEDLVAAYAALARGGQVRPVQLRADAPESAARQMMSAGAAWIVWRMLADHGRPGEGFDFLDGSQRAPLAWKTGTSYGFRDAWAIGTGTEVTIGVWIGRPDGSAVPGHYGAVTALPLLFRLFDATPRALRLRSRLPMPDSVATADICWPLGLTEDGTPAEHCHRKRQAWILDGRVPPTLPERDARRWTAAIDTYLHDDTSGLRAHHDCNDGPLRPVSVARWPVRLGPWLGRELRQRSQPPPLKPGCGEHGTPRDLRIDGVVDGALLASMDRAREATDIDLRALGAQGEVLWLLDDRVVGRTLEGEVLRLPLRGSGTRVLVAVDDSGAFDRVRFVLIGRGDQASLF
ncbi:MAG TPA: penicillin-binding protein 1C [Xanthomonadaceae bacterium]|nr:penicillin-binding protein 1C [Xanthomonadaceae bacterium]